MTHTLALESLSIDRVWVVLWDFDGQPQTHVLVGEPCGSVHEDMGL